MTAPARKVPADQPLAALRTAARRRAAANAAWHTAIRAARDSGLTYRQIAVAAGVSHQRVSQILRGGADRHPDGAQEPES